MDERISAYDLGYFSYMVRYDMVYHWRHAELHRTYILNADPAELLRRSLSRIDQRITELAGVFAKEPTLRLRDQRDRLENLVERMIRSHERDGQWDGGPYGFRDCPGKWQWEEFRIRCDAAMDGQTRLEPWYQFGRTVAHCLCQPFFCRDASETEPNAEALIEAAKGLPDSARHASDVFRRCAEADAADETGRHNAVLAVRTMLSLSEEDAKALRWPENLPAMLRFENYFRRLKPEIEYALEHQLPSIDLTLDETDQRHCQAVLNGAAYEITAEQFRILRSLLHAQGQRRRSNEIIADNAPVLGSNTRVDRHIDRLPAPLGNLVEKAKGKGGGYRLRVD